MKKIVLFAVFILSIIATTLCYGKEIKISEAEIKNKIAQYNEEFKKTSDEVIISELEKLLVILPKNFNELLRAVAIIEEVSKRDIADSKEILKKIIKKGEESPNKFVKGFAPEITLMWEAECALSRMELNEELYKYKKAKITLQEKADYLIEKLKENLKENPRKASILLEILKEMAPEIVPKLMKLLDDKNENIRRLALGLLEKSNDKNIQEEIIKIMEEEFKKPNYGFYFYCQRVLENVGDRKSYEYLKKKLIHKDPVIKKLTATTLISFWERGVISKEEIKVTLNPLLNDKNKGVSKEIEFYLLDKGVIERNDNK